MHFFGMLIILLMSIMSPPHFSFEQQKSDSSIGEYCVRYPKIAALFGIILAFWGLLAAFTIPKESAPYIAFGIVRIVTTYPGASARDIDQLITQNIEKKIKGISGLHRYRSISEEGVSSITLEFHPGEDMTKAMGDIRSKVDEARSLLPDDIDDDPHITEIDSSLEPFVSLVLSGNIPPENLTDIAHNLKEKIEDIPGVAEVEMEGNREREIVVQVQRERMEALGLSLLDVQNAILRTHNDVPIGTVAIDGYEYIIRFEGKRKSAEEIKNIDIIDAGKHIPSLVSIGNIADVIERAKDTKRITRFATLHAQEKRFLPAIELRILRRSGSDILALEEKVRTVSHLFERENMPPGVSLSITQNMASIMRDDYKKVLVSGLESVLIVLLFLFLFVGIREGLVASLVIPLTFLITIGILSFLGKTLNFMTNFSMILSLGILVDTAIVIVEGAHHFIRQGYHRKQAALLAVYEYRMPLISGTLTTLAVFIPLLSLSGILGQYLSFIPITVIIVLTTSLLVSLFLLPAYAARLLPRRQQEIKQHSRRFVLRNTIDAAINSMQRKYKTWLSWLLQTETRRLSALFLVMLTFITSFSLPIPFVLFPQDDQPFLTVIAQMPEGASTENTFRVTRDMEKVFNKYPEILFIKSETSGKEITFFIELLPEKERKKRHMRTVSVLEREILADMSPIEREGRALIRVQSEKKGPPSEFPVGFRIIAQDGRYISAAKRTAQYLTQVLKEIPLTSGVQNDVEDIPGEFRFHIRDDKAAELGVQVDEIPRILRIALQGNTVATVQRNGRDIDIVIEMKKSDISSLDDILHLSVRTKDGAFVPISDIVTYENVDAVAAIHRNDGKFSFTVSSLLEKGGNAQDITNTFFQRLQNISLPEGVTVIDAGENEQNVELLHDLFRGFLMAILLMFLVLVIQFHSFMQPLLILFTILFAQIGVAVGLFITATPRSLAYILGAIALAGIVVNDAIIMIDQINKQRRKQNNDYQHNTAHAVQNALVRAGTSRFIPIILTTLTTSAGIAPLIVQDSFWSGLSYTIIFGLIVASLLTLFLTPATYMQLSLAPWKTIGVLIIAAGIGTVLYIFLGALAFVCALCMPLLFFLMQKIPGIRREKL